MPLASHVSAISLVEIVGYVLVFGCLIAAAVIAYRTHEWLAPLVLCGVAIVTAFLLL